MSRESVGDALRKARHWLRPGGELVNMQPCGEAMQLEVRLGPERRSAGVAYDCATTLENMRASLRTLEEFVEAGLFSLRQEVVYDFEFHCEFVEDWVAFAERDNAGDVKVDEKLLDRALREMSRSGGSIVGTELDVARSYVREG